MDNNGLSERWREGHAVLNKIQYLPFLFLLGSQVAGIALLGAALKKEGGFFHTKVSILLSGPFMMGEASSSACNAD